MRKSKSSAGKSEREIISKINKFVGLLFISVGMIILIIFAWFLILVGIIGLILPIIPGIVLIVLGIYILRNKRIKKYSMRIIMKIRRL